MKVEQPFKTLCGGFLSFAQHWARDWRAQCCARECCFLSFATPAKVVSCEGLGRSRHRAPLSPSEEAVAIALGPTPAATLRPWSRCVGDGQRCVCFVCVGERDVAASVDLHNNECSSCLVLLKISTFSDGSKQQTLSARLARAWRCAPHSRSPVSLIVLPRSCSCRWGPCPSPIPRLICLFSFFFTAKILTRDGGGGQGPYLHEQDFGRTIRGNRWGSPAPDKDDTTGSQRGRHGLREGVEDVECRSAVEL